MPVATTQVDVASTVARNNVPLAGIVFLGWSASTVLVLYFADTMFALAGYAGISLLFGRWAPLLFVAVYAGISIVIDIAPDKFLRVLTGGAEDARPPATHSPTPAPRRKRKR